MICYMHPLVKKWWSTYATLYQLTSEPTKELTYIENNIHYLNLTPKEKSTLGIEESTLGIEESTLGIEESTLGTEEFTLGTEEFTLEIEEFTLGIEESTLWIEEFTLGKKNPRWG